MSKFMLALEQWAKEVYGLVIHAHLKERIEREITALLVQESLHEANFIPVLKKNNQTLITKVLDILTVQESYFFRDSSLFDYLRKKYLPQLIVNKRESGKKELRIWSAGCAQGEEIYSIAIEIFELIPDRKNWSIILLGTDINWRGLANAKQGIYTKVNLRSVSDEVKKKYFVQQDCFFYLHPEIKNMVTFDYFNLANPFGEWGIGYDIIFCRNVFIYLDKESILKSLQCFYQSLNDKGILFLGASDSIYGRQKLFTQHFVNSVYFLKKNRLQCDNKTSFESEKRRIAQKEEGSDENFLLTIKERLQKKQHQQVLASLQERPIHTSLWFRHQGEALMGVNQSEKALQVLKKAIELDPLDPVSYFLKGMVESDLKENKAAMASLQQALYLKNKFPEAAYYLGLIYLQMGKESLGIKLLKKALYFASKSANHSLFYGIDNKEKFIHSLHDSIAYYERQI